MQGLMIRNTMKKSVIKAIISCSILFVSCQQSSFAASRTTANIGTSIIYTNINEPNYNFANDKEQIKDGKTAFKSITYGLTHFQNNFAFTIQTNRFLNSSIKRAVVDKRTGMTLHNKSKLTNDTFLIGYRFGRVIPSLLLSNAKLQKSLYYNGVFQGKETKHSFVYGASVSYFLTKNLNSSLIYIAPNKELNLESAIGLGFNYLF